jgi:hypothetical protein
LDGSNQEYQKVASFEGDPYIPANDQNYFAENGQQQQKRAGFLRRRK